MNCGILKFGILILTLVTAGCSSENLLPSKPPAVHRIGTRQLPPEPVYNRLRLVHLESLPSRDLPGSSSAKIDPVINFSMRNATLEEASKVLASTSKYSSYCASTIAKQRITLNRLGTIDDLGEAIGRQAGIRVVVDHEGRSVRFFPQHIETPKFYGDGK